MSRWRRRLVEQEHRRVLRERLREDDPLPLAAGELLDRAVGQVLDRRRDHGRTDPGPVLRPAAAPGERYGVRPISTISSAVKENAGTTSCGTTATSRAASCA